jgi:hypothetical protein
VGREAAVAVHIREHEQSHASGAFPLPLAASCAVTPRRYAEQPNDWFQPNLHIVLGYPLHWYIFVNMFTGDSEVCRTFASLLRVHIMYVLSCEYFVCFLDPQHQLHGN